VYGGLALRVLELLEALWVSFEFKHPLFHACAAAIVRVWGCSPGFLSIKI